MISYENVLPQAEVRIQMPQRYHNRVSRCITHKVRTGRCVKYPYLVIGNRLFQSSKEICFDKEECVRSFRQLHVFGDYYLPVYFGALEVYEVGEYVSLQSYQTLLNELETEYQDYQKSLSGEGSRLISEQHSIFDTTDGLLLEADMIVERKADLTAAKPAVMPEQEPDE